MRTTLCLCLSICLSVLAVPVPVGVYVVSSIYAFVGLYPRVYFCLSVCPCLYFYVSACLFVCLPDCFSMPLPVSVLALIPFCPSVYPSSCLRCFAIYSLNVTQTCRYYFLSTIGRRRLLRIVTIPTQRRVFDGLHSRRHRSL